MNSIEKLDKNFEIKTAIEEPFIFRSILESPFRIYGLIPTEEGFVRMPKEAAAAVNENAAVLYRNTAGGRVRFRTDSPKIAIRAKMANIPRMSHFPLTGIAGFDLYEGRSYRGTFVPPVDIQEGYESMLDLQESREREITIHFPLYSDVRSLEIGLCEGALLEPAAEYAAELPVVYYGSSITQGGCASRPGNSYENIISRSLDCDHVNLGFSGGARGEDAIAEYIAGLSMSVFVYDYDHNATGVEHLKSTHQRMFRIIRDQNPDLPVVMVTRPQPDLRRREYGLRSVIMTTYQEALAAGDENVYFVDGNMMLQQFGGDSGTVDGIHPNDLGFMCMAKSIGEAVRKILF